MQQARSVCVYVLCNRQGLSVSMCCQGLSTVSMCCARLCLCVGPYVLRTGTGPRLHYGLLTLCVAPYVLLQVPETPECQEGQEPPPSMHPDTGAPAPPLLSHAGLGARPSPTLSPTDPVPRGLLTLCPGGASSAHRVSRPRGTGSVGDSVGEGKRRRKGVWAWLASAGCTSVVLVALVLCCRFACVTVTNAVAPSPSLSWSGLR